MNPPIPTGYRYNSQATALGLPLISIAAGPDFTKGEMRGHARGIVAIGDIATGWLAIGGLARGGVAIGGLALGVVSFGGCSLGALLALGGLSIGGVALGGCAVGFVAVGGLAIGSYALGGAALSWHDISAMSRSPEVMGFLEHWFPSLAKLLKR